MQTKCSNHENGASKSWQCALELEGRSHAGMSDVSMDRMVNVYTSVGL